VVDQDTRIEYLVADRTLLLSLIEIDCSCVATLRPLRPKSKVRTKSLNAAVRSTRRVISIAARRENVSSIIRRGSAPCTMRWATRWHNVSVRCLHDPHT